MGILYQCFLLGSSDTGGVSTCFPTWESLPCGDDVLLNMSGRASEVWLVHCPTGTTVTATLSRSIVMIGRLTHISVLV